MEEHPYSRPKSAGRSLFNLSVTLCFLLVGFSVFYYFVIFLPGKEKGRIQQEETKQMNRQLMIESCLKTAYDGYKARWDSTCKLDGKKEGCTLPRYRSEIIEAFHKELKDECYKRYQ